MSETKPETRRVIAVGTITTVAEPSKPLGGDKHSPPVLRHAQRDQAVDLPVAEAERAVELGVARWPDAPATVVSSNDENVKDTAAKVGEGKAAEADHRTAVVHGRNAGR